ncbi:hypothetical protein KA057_03865 [Candidatus Gracilibacteria bacterium]|nr:hypothetical protein [Candidatus Gracilibacteria bacterium]
MPRTEVHQSIETKIPQSTQEKPGVFRRVLSKIGNGMKEVVKTIDRGLSQTPIIGDIYKTGKGVIGGVWHVTEQIPVVGDIMKGLRQGSETIGQKMNFTEPEKTQIKTEESELMKNIGNIRDSVVRDMPESELKRDIVSMYDDILSGNKSGAEEKLQAIMKKNPEIAKVVKEQQDKINAWKTGKEGMSTEQLVQEGQELAEKLAELGVEENVKKREDIKTEEYTEFQKQFTGLPELGKIDKTGVTYSLLQNIYFNREPKPDLRNPLVQDFIQRSINIVTVDPDNEREYEEATKKHYELTQGKSKEIAEAMNLNEIERVNLELKLNIQERHNRIPPVPPHEYSGPDYGMYEAYRNAYATMFPLREASLEHKTNLIQMSKMRDYPGVFLGVFQGGGH